MWAPRYFHFVGEAFEAVPEEQRRLGILIFVALLGHIGAFCLLRVTYPPTATVEHPRTRVTLIAPAPDGAESPRFLGFVSWSSLNDPSAAIFPPDLLATSNPAGNPAPDAEVVPRWPAPSVSETAPAPLSSALEILPDRLAPLPDRASAALVIPRETPNLSAALTRLPVDHTVVQWGDALAARHPAEWSLPAVPVRLLAESDVTILRIAVDAAGHVAHALVDESSGSSDVDAIALDGVRQLRFTPAPGTGLLWGRATLFWRFQAAEAPASPATATPAAP